MIHPLWLVSCWTQAACKRLTSVLALCITPFGWYLAGLRLQQVKSLMNHLEVVDLGLG